MTPTLVLTLLLSVLIGLSLGLLGGGGSILTVPILTHVAGLDPQEAIAASLFVVGVTSAVSAIAHARNQRVKWRTGLVFGAAGMAGALTGGLAGGHGRKPVLVAGWLIATPVPVLLIYGPTWGWIVAASLVLGLGLSVLTVAETRAHAHPEATGHVSTHAHGSLSNRQAFALTGFRDSSLSAVSRAGMVNNLNDGLAWGLFPVLFITAGLSLGQIGLLAAAYPAVWGAGQPATGALSDR